MKVLGWLGKLGILRSMNNNNRKINKSYLMLFLIKIFQESFKLESLDFITVVL